MSFKFINTPVHESSTLFHIQIGDIYYHTISERVSKWKVLGINRHQVRITSTQGNNLTLMKANWDGLTQSRLMVAHKDLVDIHGEEAIFEHLLADSLKELLTIYVETFNDTNRT